MITSLELGGAQISVTQIVDGLRSRGIDAHLAYSSAGGARPGGPQPLAIDAVRRGIPLHDVSSMRRAPSVFDVTALGQLHRLIDRLQPAIVHTHASKAGLLGRTAALSRRQRRCVVHSVRGWPWHGRRATARAAFVAIERQLARVTDHFVAVSHAMIEAGLRHGIGRAQDYSMIRSGIELSRFRPRGADRRAARRALGLPDGPLVGTVGRLSAQKAPLDFVAMASRVARTHRSVHFLIAGDGEDRALVERHVQASPLAGRCLILGERSDIPELLAAMDVFVLTSRWEGMPRAAVEAAASEVPIVATDVGGTGEIVGSESGILCAPGAIEQLATSVRRLLEDRELARRLAAGARNRVTVDFDIARVIEQHQQLYQRLEDR